MTAPIGTRLRQEVARLDREIKRLRHQQAVLTDALAALEGTTKSTPAPASPPAQAAAKAPPAWAVELKLESLAQAPAPKPAQPSPEQIALEGRVRQFLEVNGPAKVKAIAEAVNATYGQAYNVLIGRHRAWFRQDLKSKEWSLKTHG